MRRRQLDSVKMDETDLMRSRMWAWARIVFPSTLIRFFEAMLSVHSRRSFVGLIFSTLIGNGEVQSGTQLGKLASFRACGGRSVHQMRKSCRSSMIYVAASVKTSCSVL